MSFFNLKNNTGNLSFLNQRVRCDLRKKLKPYKTAIFSERGEVGALIELEVKIKIIRGVILKIAADHPDTDFKIREFSGKPIEGGDYGWFAYTFQQMPVILLMRIDFNKKNVTLFFNDLKGNVSFTWRREFNKVRFKEIELNKIIKQWN